MGRRKNIFMTFLCFLPESGRLPSYFEAPNKLFYDRNIDTKFVGKICCVLLVVTVSVNFT